MVVWNALTFIHSCVLLTFLSVCCCRCCRSQLSTVCLSLMNHTRLCRSVASCHSCLAVYTFVNNQTSRCLPWQTLTPMSHHLACPNSMDQLYCLLCNRPTSMGQLYCLLCNRPTSMGQLYCLLCNRPTSMGQLYCLLLLAVAQ